MESPRDRILIQSRYVFAIFVTSNRDEFAKFVLNVANGRSASPRFNNRERGHCLCVSIFWIRSTLSSAYQTAPMGC